MNFFLKKWIKVVCLSCNLIRNNGKLVKNAYLIQMLFKKDTKWVQKILNEFLVEITHRIFCKNFLKIDTDFAKMLSDSSKKCSTL